MQKHQNNNENQYEIDYICESDFLKSDPTFSHLSFMELFVYHSIPERFLKKEENHSLSIQKNLNTNEYEIIKKYNRKLPKLDPRRIYRKIESKENLYDAYDIFRAVLNIDEYKEFMSNCLNVIYKSRDLWDVIKKAEEIYKYYYEDDKIMLMVKPCKHKKPEISPFCLVKC